MRYVTHLLIRLQIFSALSTERIHNVLIQVVPVTDLAKYLWHAVIGQTAFFMLLPSSVQYCLRIEMLSG